MASCEVANYTMMGSNDTCLTRNEGSTIIFIIVEKVCSHCSFHLKASAFLNSFIIGFDPSTSIGKNLAKAFSLPINLCTSFKFVGLVMFKIASHLSGFASMPLLVNMNPKNFPSLTPKTHFSRFNHKLYFLIFANSSSRSFTCSSTTHDLTIMSST